MRIIVDTNVFISGIFFSGPPYEILRAWKNNKIQIVVSPEILEEYYRVSEELNSKFNQINIEEFIELLTIEAELISTPITSVKICDDPDDDKFIACAIAAKVKTIVSGDKHLLQVAGYNKIEILKPRLFFEKYLIK